MTTAAPPGWYEPPGSGQLRWWNGESWSDAEVVEPHSEPAPAPAPAPTAHSAAAVLTPPVIPRVTSPPPPGFPTDDDEGVPPAGGITFAPPPAMRAVSLDDHDHGGGRAPNLVLAVLGGLTLVGSGALSWVIFRTPDATVGSYLSELFSDGPDVLSATGPLPLMLGVAALVAGRHRISRTGPRNVVHPLNVIAWMTLALIAYTLLSVLRLRRLLDESGVGAVGGALGDVQAEDLSLIEGFIPAPGMAVAFVGALLLFLAAAEVNRR